MENSSGNAATGGATPVFSKNIRAGIEAAHAAAEAARAQYGNSGSAYRATTTPQSQYSQSYYSQQTSAADAGGSIDSWYKAYEEAALAALKSAYDQNVLTIEGGRAKIAPYYQDARNMTSTQSELSRAAFNELAAAKGLSSGAGGQASLAMSNVLQSDMSGLSRAEADAYAEVDLQRARLDAAYKNDIAKAVADGNLAKAQMLYSEYVRVDNAMMSMAQAQAKEDYKAWEARNATSNSNSNQQKTAQMLAQFGDFSGYAALGYTPAQILLMQMTHTGQAAK